MIYGDVIPLTGALASYLTANAAPAAWPPANLRVLPDLDPESVVPFLTQHLEWRIVDAAGVVKSADDVTRAGLELVVGYRTFTFPKEEDVGPLGQYGPYEFYPAVTAGKVGGAPAGA